jgi:hypothetical protein
VKVVGAVDGRDDRTGVEQECHAGRCRRPRIISSCRSARSPRPDSQIPVIDICRLAAFWPGGRGEFGIGGDKPAKLLSLARAEPIHQVVQVVIVVSCCHAEQPTAVRIRLPRAAGLPGLALTWASYVIVPSRPQFMLPVNKDCFSDRSPWRYTFCLTLGFRWQLQRRDSLASQVSDPAPSRRRPGEDSSTVQVHSPRAGSRVAAAAPSAPPPARAAGCAVAPCAPGPGRRWRGAE